LRELKAYPRIVDQKAAPLKLDTVVDDKRNIRNRKWENMGQQADEKGTQIPC